MKTLCRQLSVQKRDPRQLQQLPRSVIKNHWVRSLPNLRPTKFCRHCRRKSQNRGQSLAVSAIWQSSQILLRRMYLRMLLAKPWSPQQSIGSILASTLAPPGKDRANFQKPASHTA